MSRDLTEYLALAERLAVAGGEVLLDFVPKMAEVRTEFKGRSTELVTVADRAAEEVIVKGLLEAFPTHGVLAEEGVLTPKGKASLGSEDCLWIVDPLDGTTNFVHGMDYFSVAIALAIGGQPVVGVVHAPAMGRTYTAARGHGAYCNGRPIHVTDTDQVAAALVATGFSYNRSEPGADDNTARLTRALHAVRDLRRFGSAELDLCLTAEGRFDAYWEMYLAPYDVAAGSVVVQEAGGRVSDLVGADDWLYGGQVLASNGVIHQEMLNLVGGPPAICDP
jgi:myo-inositol-1(or 4)-monophosphatase